jgi:hypothetical protein
MRAGQRRLPATNTSDTPPAKISLPPELDAFLQARLKAQMDKTRLAELYTQHAWAASPVHLLVSGSIRVG